MRRHLLALSPIVGLLAACPDDAPGPGVAGIDALGEPLRNGWVYLYY